MKIINMDNINFEHLLCSTMGLDRCRMTLSRLMTLAILLCSVAVAIYLDTQGGFLAQTVRLGDLTFEGPLDIRLPDGIPHIREIREFMVNITKREDYREPLDRSEETVISRSEAASIMFELARRREVPGPVLCDKYFKLFESDKYQTLGGAEELVGNARDFDEIEQPDANLPAHLSAERNYNSLKRLSLLHSVLVEEGIGVASTIDIKVQKNMLQCIQYYKDRHERALDGLSDYLWTKREEIPRYTGNLNKLAAQFKYFVGIISGIEREMDEKEAAGDEAARAKLENDWLNRMVKLHKTVQLSAPMIPNSVKKFIEHERRQAQFKNIVSLMEQYERHKRRVLEIEGDRNRLNDYREALLSLYEFAKPHESWLQEEFSFISEPRRDSLIVGHIFKLEHQNVEMPVPKQLLSVPMEEAVKRKMLVEVEKAEQQHEEEQRKQQEMETPELGLEEHPPAKLPEVGLLPGGWGDKPFSLEADEDYNEERSLDEYDITFYVKPNFEQTYSEGDHLLNILSDVIREALDDLQKKCLTEKARRVPKVSCEKHQKINKIIESN